LQLAAPALFLLAMGRRAAARAALVAGLAIVEPLGPPGGPPTPSKPIHELYGEVLLELGRPQRALALFEASLVRTPDRPLSLRGLARAQGLAGRAERSGETWSRLIEIRENRDTAVGVAEARAALTAPIVPAAASASAAASTPRGAPDGSPKSAVGEHPHH
jgi:hypothetical protein